MPGIFVLDTAAKAQSSTEDGTVNARLNGAEPGSIVRFTRPVQDKLTVRCSMDAE